MKDFKLTFTTLEECKSKLTNMFDVDPKGAYRLIITKWTKKRSISANNQQHLWYGQIAKHHGDRSAEYVKRFCKLTFGVPILLNSDKHQDFYETLFDMCDFWRRDYETRIDLMEGIEITSKLNTVESKEYMDNMIFYFNDIGIPIKFKD